MAPDNLVIQTAWQQYTEGASLDVCGLNPFIATSWQRCHNLSVDPLRLNCESLDVARLEDRLQRHHRLINIVRPVMERLYDFVKGTGFQVVLSDEVGMVLEVIGDPDVVALTRRVDMCPGGDWSEASKGTNAIGTAIFERRPLQVFGAEHYCKPNHFLICSASPIFDADGNMVGVLDLSGDYHHSSGHTLGMVVSAVGAIENQLRLQAATQKLYAAYRYSNILLNNMSDGLVSVDNRGYITEINARGAEMLGLDPKAARGQHISNLGTCDLQLVHSLQEGVEHEDTEIVFGRQGRKVRNSTSLLRDEEGRTIGAVATFREVARYRPAPVPRALAGRHYSIDDIMGESPLIADVKTRTRIAAGSVSTVLIEGESGTGKEVVAQAIHFSGARANGPFIAVNCAALPEALVESELFGYEEGAFTGARRGGQAGKFEMANGGTIFLDEIGDMPLSAQMKLLRVMQERKVTRVGSAIARDVNIRIIAATLKDLQQEVEKGNFRQDLYYRINVLNIAVPPLRKRSEDIPELARSLARRIAERLCVEAKELDPALIEKLQAYPWPGNVRELENVLERAINQAEDDAVLKPEHLALPQAKPMEAPAAAAPETIPIGPLEDVERDIIRRTMLFHKGNVQKAAASLGISRNTLYRKLKEYGESDSIA